MAAGRDNFSLRIGRGVRIGDLRHVQLGEEFRIFYGNRACGGYRSNRTYLHNDGIQQRVGRKGRVVETFPSRQVAVGIDLDPYSASRQADLGQGQCVRCCYRGTGRQRAGLHRCGIVYVGAQKAASILVEAKFEWPNPNFGRGHFKVYYLLPISSSLYHWPVARRARKTTRTALELLISSRMNVFENYRASRFAPYT